MFKVRRGSSEEIPLLQGKEQRLRFAGAAVKIYMCVCVCVCVCVYIYICVYICI